MNDRILFRTAHRRLTFLCAGITAAILCLFSCLYLYLAERTLQDSHQLAFSQSMSNLTDSLKQQTVVTHSYLNTLEQNNDYQIYLWDHGVPYHFNEISNHTLSNEVQELLLSLLSTGNEEAEQSTPAPTSLPGVRYTLLSAGTNLVLVHLKLEPDIEYMVYAVRLNIGQRSGMQILAESETPEVALLVASSREGLTRQLREQRLRFLLIDLTGILLLTMFAWFFTGKMLRPLRESHDRQIRFVADASHELRTPLAVIRACMHAKPPAYEQTIDQECAQMGRLIEDLLTLSRLDQGEALSQYQDVDLDTLLLTVYEQMELLAVQHKIHLQLHLPQDALPHIQGDRHRLEQLLTILLQNALSYTPEGGSVTLSARLTADRSRAIQILVADNGPGIPDADKIHIFERFYRAEQSHTDRSHFGLGLCIAREIASSHGGTLTVSDTEGGGTTFCLSLKAITP
ncbi:MAG: HAMP domain-containing histidine kinase [bacterium]|nr:HAMP domain-containing histidine kinase [bacterium]MCM1376432.1 HAMP domain-containing histidine kinase [Muribaculum sp.]